MGHSVQASARRRHCRHKRGAQPAGEIGEELSCGFADCCQHGLHIERQLRLELLVRHEHTGRAEARQQPLRHDGLLAEPVRENLLGVQQSCLYPWDHGDTEGSGVSIRHSGARIGPEREALPDAAAVASGEHPADQIDHAERVLDVAELARVAAITEPTSSVQTIGFES